MNSKRHDYVRGVAKHLLTTSTMSALVRATMEELLEVILDLQTENRMLREAVAKNAKDLPVPENYFKPVEIGKWEEEDPRS